MEEVKKLYTALIGKGYTANDLGSEDVFAKKMQDEQNRRELYDYVSSRGDFKIGSYDNYEQRLRPAQVQKTQPVVDAYGMPMQPEVSTIEDAPKVPQVNMDEFTVNETYLNNIADNEGAPAPMEGVEFKENLKSDLFKPQSTETPSLLNVDTQPKDYFAEAGAKAMESIRQERQAREYQEIMKPLSGDGGRERIAILEERKKQIEAQLNQPDAVRNAAARTNMAKALENVDKELQVLNEQQKQWQEQYGSWTPSSARRFREQTMEQTWYDPYAVVPEEYKALATQKWGKEGSEDAYFSAWMNLSPEEREAFVKREHIKSFFNEETANRMQGIRERALEEKGRGIAKSAMSPMGYNNSAEAAMDRMVQDASNVGTQTIKALDKAEEIKQAYKNHELDENFFAGAYKGMKDGLTDIDNWTGLYMVGEMTNLYDIADKMEKGEALSQTEEDFLDAQAYKLAVEAALADDLGWGYSSGNVTGASVPFMLQMLASPIGGASGKAIDKGFAAVGRRAIDKFGKGILKKLLTKAPVKKIAKGLVGTVGKGIGQTILFGSDRVAAGTMERHLGNEMVAERANEEFNAGVQAKAGEDLGTALFKAGVSASMENISEFAGGAFIDDFTKMVGKKISKEFMDAMGGSVGKRMAKAAARQNANKVFRAIANNKWGQHAVNLSKSVQSGMEWDGLLNEFLEEVLNNVSNVMIGDMSMEDFTSLEKNAETLLGLAWTSGFFMANNAASRVGGYVRGNIALKRTDRAARQIFTGDMQEKWDAYTQALSQADGYEEVEQLYKGLMTDISKNQDKEAAKAQMSEATAYMANYVKMMGMNAATEEADEEEQKTPAQKDVETAQGEGIAAQGTEEELDVVEEMDESYNQLAGHLEGTNVEDWLLQYGETADKQLEAIRGSELDEQTKAMAEAYLTSAQRYEGLLLANQEEVDAIVEEAAKEFDANVNQELGSVIQVLTTQGKTAYVIQGNPNERENIRLRYEDGTTEPVSHVAIEKVLSQADAQTMRSDMIEGVRKSAVAEVVKRMQGVVPNATQMQMPVGHNVVVDGQAGVVAGVNADGTMQIQMQGGNVVNAAPQQVMDAQAYNTIMERKARARESARVSVPVREEVATPVAEEATAAEAVAEEAVAEEEELTEAQKLLQEYMDESVSLEDRQAILGNNVAQAKQAAMEAQAEVDAMTESKPKATDYTSIAEFKQAQEQWKAQMQEKQQALDLARQQEATWSEVQKGMVQPVETATEQTSAEAVPATPQVTEVQRAEAKNHNSKHDIKALAKEIGVSAKRIQRVIDFANQVSVKLNFANVTRTQGGKGAFTNADNIAKEREITLSKYQLAKGMAIEWVMGHELTHQIKADGNAANWEAYKQAIINALGQDAFDKRVKEQSKVYREAGAYQDMPANEFVETMQEEVCADAAGDMLLNPDNMNKVMGVPQSLASRIWNGLKNMVTFSTPSKIKQAVDAWQMLAEGKELTGEADGRKRHSITNKNNRFNEHTNEEKIVSLQTKTREYEHDQVARLSGEGDAISTLHRTTSPYSGTDNRAAEKARPRGWQKESLLGSLIRRAKEDETWIKDIRPLVGRFISSAGEHEVFFSRKGDTVIKLNDFEYLPENSTDFTSFINRIESFNELFPDVAVTVVGYTYNSEGKVSVVLEQPVVDAEREATEAEIDAFMEDHDFYMDMSGEYTDGRYVVYDLKPNNVYVDKSGSLRFFDALVFDESRAGTMLTIPHDIKKRKKFVAPYQEDPTAEPRYSLVGTTGARALDKAEGTTVRMDNMDVAEEMEAAGKDAETIWLATGWERGADGKWKYEVLEDFAYEEPRAKAERLQEEYQQVQNEKENIYRYLNRFPARGLTEQQKAIKKEQNARLKKLIKKSEQLQDEIIESNFDTTLGELIGTDNNIIRAYPELASMPVSFVASSRFMDAGLKGAFDGEGIWINPTLENTAPTLLHEVQHAIQRIEGFARGGNTGSVKTKADALREDVRPLHEMMLDTPEWAERQRLQNRWFDETDAAEIAKIEQRVNEINGSGVLDAIQSKRKQLQEKYGSDATVGKILGSPYAEDAEIWQQLPESFNDKYEAYRNLAGEAEARNVSARLNMSEEERRQTRPGKTEDVAREEQTVIYAEVSDKDGAQLEETASATRYSIVVDPQLIAELKASPKRKGYRNVVQREDGLFEAPMGNSLRGNGITVENTPFAMGQWEQSEEHPELVYGDNKITLVKPDGKTVADVNYNPYIHNRLNTLNAQFKQAWERPDLVYIETEVPETDLEGGYMAEHAHLSTGVHQWSNGALMLSRYDKPVRIVPWDEVAIPWIEKYKKSGVHFDIVPPALRPILAEAGVEIKAPHNGMGENCIKAYEEWKAEQEEKKFSLVDYQGNPLNDDGTLVLERVSSIAELTDNDFEESSRSIILPKLPENVDKAIGAGGKDVIIKKNIFERNYIRHSELTPDNSREILQAALYSPNIYGQNQKSKRPKNWVVISVASKSGANKLVLLEISDNKEFVEIVHWHYIDQRGIEKIKRQAGREGGQLLILPSVSAEEVGALSDLTTSLSSASKDTQSVSTEQTDKKEISEKSAESNVEVTNEEVMHSISPIEGYTYSEVIDMVQNDVENILSEEGADNVEAVEFWAHGSRMRGNAKEDSDLDVVMFYKGNEKEDSLFNLINEHELAIDGIKVDVNPIRISNEQDIARYKEKSARYDQEMRFSLAGLHNISEEKLKKAIIQGGFANPSVAVIDLDTRDHNTYGDITLVLPSYMIDKKQGRNAGTYMGDAWTPTYPRVSMRLDNKGWRKIDEFIASISDDAHMRSNMHYAVEDFMQGGSTPYMQYAFLRTKGIEIPFVYKNNDRYISNEEFKELIGMDALTAFNDSIDTYNRFKELPKEVQDELYIWIINRGDKAKIKAMKESIQKDQRYANLLDYEVPFSKFNMFANDTFRREQDNGKIDYTKTFSEANNYVATNGLGAEYNAWISNLLEEAGAEEYIFAGFTPSGNAKYLPHTLENVSKVMKKDGKSNAYNNTGYGPTRAGIIKALSTLGQIRKNSETLRTDINTVDETKEELTDRLYELRSKLADMRKLSDNPFINGDYAESRLQEALSRKNPVRYLNEEYGYNIEEDGDFAKKLESFIDDVRKAPVRYFETKFERPVMLDEFHAAVIPNDTDTEVVKALEKAGLNVETYERGNDTERKEALLRASDEHVRFSLSAEEQDAENADIRYSMPGHSVASRIYGHPFTGAWQKFLQRAPKGVLKPGYGIIDESRLPEFADWYRMLVPEAEEYKEFVSLFLEDATATEKKHIHSVMDRVDKIVDDYRRLAEGDNSVLSLENNARFSITPDILAANERFNEELDEFKAKTHKGLLHLGKPGAILRTIGVDADEMTISPTILHQHLKEHGLTVDDIKGLALSVQSPILAYRHGLKYPNLVIVTEMDVKGGKLSVSLELDGDGHVVAISNIKSVHSKDAIKEIERLMDMGAESLRDNLKWVEKEEVSDWLLRLPYEDERTKDNPKLSSVANVLLSFQNPPIIGDESSQNVENAKSGEQKYSLPAGIPRRRKNESLMDYANRIADILYAQRNATRDWELQEPAIALARDKYEDRVSSGWYQTKEALQDSMLGLKVFMESVLGKGTYVEDVAGVENAYLGENRLSSVNFAEASEFARLVFKPMLEEVAKLAKNDKQRQMLVDYMMAKHGLERNRVMAEKDAQAEAKENQMMTLDELRAKYRNKDYAGLTALTNKQNIRAAEAEAQAMVDAYESTHDTSALWDKVKKTNTATLTKMRESGLLSQEMYDNIANMYEFYIPLRGFDEKTSDEAYAYLSHKDSAFNAPIRRAKGRKSKADDPFAQMQAMAESAIMQGNRNVLVKQKLLNFVQNHPSDLATVSEMWISYDAVNKEWTQITASISPTDTPADVARKTREFNETMEELHKLFPGRYQKAGGRNRIPYKVIAKNLSEHQVIVKRNGVDYVITINGSPRAAQAVNGMTNPDSGTGAVSKLFEYGEKVNRVLSGVYTSYNPDFLWSNFIRDTLYTNTMSYVKESPAWAFRFNRNFLKFNPATMGRLLYKWDNGKLDMNDRTEALFYQFMKNGGETGYANIRNIEQHKSEIKEALKKANGRVSTKLAWDAVKNKLEFISRAAENGARFAAFATSMQMGRGVERAIYDAKEVSVNFNKKGSGATFMGATGQTMVGNAAAFTSGLGRSLYVFWNAAIQGSTNFGRAAKRHPVRALTVSSVMFGLGVLMSMIGGDDEDDENAFYNLPENIRRTNIMMRFGNHWLTLPLPVEYRAMYGMGQLAGEVLSGKSRMSDWELGMAIAQQVSQMAPIDVLGAGGGWNAFMPSWAKPITDAYVLEKNWAGQPLYKDWDTYAPEWTKAYDSADQNIVGFTRWLNEVSGGNDHRKGGIDLNPAKIEAVIDGYFGGISALTKNLVKTGEMLIGERDYQPRNIPLLRRVVYQGDERTAYRRANEQYRKYKEDHDELQREIRGYEGDMEMGTKDWTEELDHIYNSPEIEQYYIMDWYGKDISKLNKQFNDATDEEEKDAIRKEINLLKSEAVREIENLQNKKEKQE